MTLSTTNARTIQIFLPDGNPRGVRIADFTSRTVRVLQVPRAQLEQGSQRLELANVGLYFLLGMTDWTVPLLTDITIR